MKYIVFLITGLLIGFQCLSVSAGTCPPSSESTTSMSPAEYVKRCSEGTTGVSPIKVGEGVDGVKNFVTSLAEKLVQFGALFAVGAIVWSGIQYTKSFGDDESLKKAKNTGIYALIGLLLLLVSFPFVDIVVNFIYDLGK